jgi:hypothetical protein
MTTPDPISKLARDIKAAVTTLSPAEARFLVDAYYTQQEYRKAAGNQVLALAKSGEPHEILKWLFDQNETLEKQIMRALDKWTDTQPLGRWAKSICGIGPVIAAGLLAHIDISKAPVAGKIWRFAGLDPTVKWGKNEKRPWNAELKTLCWKIGESFVKVSAKENDFYGRFYVERKKSEWKANLAGELAGRAKEALEGKRFKKEDNYSKRWYEGMLDPATVKDYLDNDEGMLKIPNAEPGKGVPMLPPAHIHARAKRWAVKLFLAHYQHVGWFLATGEEPPKPYAIAILGHVDFVRPPNFKPEAAE